MLQWAMPPWSNIPKPHQPADSAIPKATILEKKLARYQGELASSRVIVQDNDASLEQRAALVTTKATVVAQALLAPTEKAAG